MNINVQQIIRRYKSTDVGDQGEDNSARLVDGPCQGKGQSHGHNVVEMEMEFKIQGIEDARNQGADRDGRRSTTRLSLFKLPPGCRAGWSQTCSPHQHRDLQDLPQN